MLPHLDTLFWFQDNQSELFLLNDACLAEKRQIPILKCLVWPDRGSNPRFTALEACTLTITPTVRCKDDMLWERNNILSEQNIFLWGTKYLSCRNKIISWGNNIICCGNKIKTNSGWLRPCDNFFYFVPSIWYLVPTTYYFVPTRKIFCSHIILSCSLNILFCSHNILSRSLNILFSSRSKMATSGENSLTLDLMGNAFKDLLHRNYWVNWNHTWS
jgi:hypothetical protein